jgi:hypothetical protein
MTQCKVNGVERSCDGGPEMPLFMWPRLSRSMIRGTNGFTLPLRSSQLSRLPHHRLVSCWSRVPSWLCAPRTRCGAVTLMAGQLGRAAMFANVLGAPMTASTPEVAHAPEACTAVCPSPEQDRAVPGNGYP